MSGAEIVDGNVHAQFRQLPKICRNLIEVRHHSRFGNFQLKPFSLETCFAEDLLNSVGIGVHLNFFGRYVDGDAERRQACFLPGTVAPAGCGQNPVTDRYDLVTGLGNRDRLTHLELIWMNTSLNRDSFSNFGLT